MDEVFSVPRPRVNVSLLPKFIGKSVTIVGNVDSAKIAADGNSFVLSDGNDKNVKIMLDAPLNDMIEGIVEVTGTVDDRCNVQGVMYRVFDSTAKFNMEMYDKTVNLIHEYPEFGGYSQV